MGKMETLTPVKSKPLNRLTHNLSGLITSVRGTLVPNLEKKSVHGGLLGKGVKYNFLCDFFIIFFSRTNVEKTDFDARWLKRRGIAQSMCILGVIK